MDIRELIKDRLEVAQKEREVINAKNKAKEELEISRLTPAQIQSWRTVIGPFSVLMSDQQIQDYRDMMQSRIERIADEVHKRTT